MRGLAWLTSAVVAAGCIEFDATRAHVCATRGFCDDGGVEVPDGGFLLPDGGLLDAGPLDPGMLRVVTAGAGEVEWVEGAQRCAGLCDFLVGTAGATLRAHPAAGHGLAAWGGGCQVSADQRECAATPAAGLTLTAAFGRANLVFATRTLRDVGFISRDAGAAGDVIDALCNDEALDAGFPGTYRAWLSHFDNPTAGVPQRHVGELLGSAEGWVRLDGRLFAGSRAALHAGEVLHPVRFDSRGVTLGAGSLLATGSGADGGTVLPGGDCFSWTLESGEFAYSRPTRAGLEWSNIGSGSPCVGQARFLCLGVDARVTVFPPRATGRRVFVTQNTLTSSSMTSSRTSLCSAEALDAGLSGSWRPWSVTADAGVLANVPWVRMDGAPLLDGVVPLRGELLAPISYTARGTQRAGATALSNTSTTCASGGVHDVQALLQATGCPSSGPVICFEE